MKRPAKKPAFALATVLVLLGVVLFEMGALTSIIGLESKISLSNAQGTTAYYAAESGLEDALWKCNHDPSFVNKLAANQFNPALVYTLTNLPSSGLGSTVTILSTAPGYATVSSVGTSVNGGSFTATRAVQATVFQSGGATGGTLGTNAMMSGGSLTVSTPGSSVVINNGDVYAGGSIGITANGGGSFSDQNHTLSTSGSYTGQGTITYGSLVTSASSQLPPGVDFSSGSSGYANAANYSKMYDISVPAQLTQFETDITSGNGLVGPVTYVNGSISFGSWAKNKNLKINGLLVINGNLSTSSSNPLGNVSINDPGNHRSGILANGSITLANGTWSVNGVLYASGSLQLSTSNPFNINGGAVVAGGAITLSPGGQISISYSNTIPAAVFGPTAGPAYAAAIEHWEEEY